MSDWRNELNSTEQEGVEQEQQTKGIECRNDADIKCMGAKRDLQKYSFTSTWNCNVTFTVST